MPIKLILHHGLFWTITLLTFCTIGIFTSLRESVKLLRSHTNFIDGVTFRKIDDSFTHVKSYLANAWLIIVPIIIILKFVIKA